MSSILAELRVNGRHYRLTACSFGVHQATDSRGRVNARVRYEPVQLTLDVPADDFLSDWAAAAQKSYAADVVFVDAKGGQTSETLHLPTAYCVEYTEQFAQGDAAGGAYQAGLTLSAPGGFTLAAGDAAPLVVAAARSYAAPAALERESSREVPDATGSLAPATGALVLAPELEAMLGTTLHIEDLPPFVERVRQDLHLIYTTPSGKAMLDSLHASGQQVAIDYAMGANNIADYASPGARFLQADGSPGQGTSSVIGYNPQLLKLGPEPWATRPPAIALAHELVHAEQAAYGRMSRAVATNGSAPAIYGEPKSPTADVRELEAVGVPPHDTYPFSENKIRQEWNPPQPLREYY